MSNIVAKLLNISKHYGEGELVVKALDDLNLEIKEGDYLAVMGASGSGKSTAMNIFCLLYTSPSPRDVEESRMPSSA